MGAAFLPIPWLNINVPQLGCFLAFWAINMLVIYLGIDSIRLLLNIKAPLLIVLGLALLAWAYRQANGFGPMLSQPSQFGPEGSEGRPVLGLLLSGLDRHHRRSGQRYRSIFQISPAMPDRRETRFWARRSGFR